MVWGCKSDKSLDRSAATIRLLRGVSLDYIIIFMLINVSQALKPCATLRTLRLISFFRGPETRNWKLEQETASCLFYKPFYLLSNFAILDRVDRSLHQTFSVNLSSRLQHQQISDAAMRQYFFFKRGNWKEVVVMKRISILALLLFAGLFLFASCGGGGGGGSTPSSDWDSMTWDQDNWA